MIDASPDSLASPNAPVEQNADDDATPAPPNLVVTAVLTLAVVVIVAFGLLATFMSPLFFLGVLVPFFPLALVVIRSS